MVLSESTRSGNQKLSTMERGDQMDGDRYVYRYPEISPESNLCRLYKSPSDETINQSPPCVYIHMHKDHIRTVTIL